MEKSYHGFCDAQMKNPREAFRAIPRAESLTQLEKTGRGSVSDFYSTTALRVSEPGRLRFRDSVRH